MCVRRPYVRVRMFDLEVKGIINHQNIRLTGFQEQYNCTPFGIELFETSAGFVRKLNVCVRRFYLGRLKHNLLLFG